MRYTLLRSIVWPSVFVGAVLLISHFLLGRFLGDSPAPFTGLLAAVFLASRFGGMGGGLVAILLSIPSGMFLLMEPTSSFSIDSAVDLVRIGLFIVLGVCMSWINDSLVRAARQFRGAFEQAATGVAHLSMKRKCARVNGRLCDLLGYTKREMEGKDFLGLVHEEDREMVKAALAKAVEGNAASPSVEHRCVRKDGTVVWVDSTLSVMQKDDRPEYFIWMLTDVTERHDAQEALKEAGRQKDIFLATLGHELRSPLAPLSSSLAILGMLEEPSNKESERWRKVAESQVVQLRRLVDDLSDVSRISRGVVELRKEMVKVDPIVDASAEVVRPLVDEKGHVFEVRVEARGLLIDADPARIQQILVNLLNNAAKYTPKKGYILLTVSRSGDEARISVKDTGQGLTPEMMGRVFDLFDRGYESTRGGQPGLGIGLALARGLALQHGGGLRAFSEGEGRGSEFVLTLPLASRPVGKTATPTGGVWVSKGHGVHHRFPSSCPGSEGRAAADQG